MPHDKSLAQNYPPPASPTALCPTCRMPAEWEPHEAVWLSWPLNSRTWPNNLASAQSAIATFAATLSRLETVRINAAAHAHQMILKQIEPHNPVLSNIQLFDHPTNDAWCRDHGPVFSFDHTRQLVAVRFRYNAWGGKIPPWDLDELVPKHIAATLGLPILELPIFGEGGAIEVNGQGTLITTESVWLNPNRNPAISRDRIETILHHALGIANFCWLTAGMHNDDTDGHVDTIARFYNHSSVLAVISDNHKSPDYLTLRDNLDRLLNHTTSNGARLNVTTLPLPNPIPSPDTRRRSLPATYANFLIVNNAVIVPIYNQPRYDNEACEIISHCFPDRQIVPLDASQVIVEGGAWHCLSQQQPSHAACRQPQP